jgi:glycosyltransferase involved in cell wall biosynthesis
MKILLLSNPSSSHTIKWANSLQEAGLEILVFGLSRYNSADFKKDILIETVPFLDKLKNKSDGNISKLIYLKSLKTLKKCINSFKPDIIHSHYASSYGLLGALTNFHPFIISIWGSDIYNFPKKSFIHKKILKYSFSKADAIFSTSKSMKIAAELYTNNPVKVLNFGVDLEKFKPIPVKSLFKNEDIVIGTVKTLDYNYGIEYLILAFNELVKKYPSIPLKLLLVGGGGMTDTLKEKVDQLGLTERTIFTGLIPFSEVPVYHNMMDIEVFPSIKEGFGVSIVEAMACERPVVASNVGGIPEIVDDGNTGFLIPSENIELLVYTLEKYILSHELRTKFGKAGRERVKNFFDWNKNLDEMISFYNTYPTKPPRR